MATTTGADETKKILRVGFDYITEKKALCVQNTKEVPQTYMINAEPLG